MTLHQITAALVVICGIFLLWCAFSKDGAPIGLKPPLAILGISAMIFGGLILLLDEQSFRSYVGPRIVTWLRWFKSFVGGIGTGAVVCSLVYGHWKSVSGHWKSAWLDWRKSKGCH